MEDFTLETIRALIEALEELEKTMKRTAKPATLKPWQYVEKYYTWLSQFYCNDILDDAISGGYGSKLGHVSHVCSIKLAAVIHGVHEEMGLGELDWNDKGQYKHSFYYDHEEYKVYTDDDRIFQNQPDRNLYMHKEAESRVREIVGEDFLKMLFGEEV